MPMSEEAKETGSAIASNSERSLKLPWEKVGISPLGGAKPFDAITDVFIPACILGMATCFAYFLIEVRVVWSSSGVDALRYACFWFLMAVVLIARLRTKHGGAAVAAPYQVALAGAMLLFMFRFSGDVGGIAGTTTRMGGQSSLLLVNCFIIAIAWWGISRLTDECTSEEDSADESEQGLLSGLSKSSEHTSAGDTRLGEKELSRDFSCRRRHPGRLVIYFALGALLAFGVCQKALAAGGHEAASRAFRWMVAYIFFSLFLLALTSLSGLRLYLRTRSLKMEPSLPAKWMSAATMVIVGLLLMAAVMPRLAATGREWIARNLPGIGSPSVQERPLSSPVEGFRAPRGEMGATEGESPGSKGASAIDQGKSGGKGAPEPGEGDEANRQAAGTESGTKGGQGTGDEKTGQGKGDSPSNDQDASAQENRPQQQGTEGEQSQGDARQDESATGETQNRDSRDAREDADGNRREHQREEPNPLLEKLSRLLALLAAIAAVLIALVAVARQIPEVRQFLRDFRPRFPLIALLAERWRVMGDRLSRMFSNLHRGRGTPASQTARRKQATNPFRYAGFLETEAPAAAVQQAYGCFLEYADARGFPRQEQWTPIEFLRNLPEGFDAIREEVALLTKLYVLASYTPAEVSPTELERLRSRWGKLVQDAERHIFGAAPAPGDAQASGDAT